MAFPEELRKLALKVLMVAPMTATLEVLAAWTQVKHFAEIVTVKVAMRPGIR